MRTYVQACQHAYPTLQGAACGGRAWCPLPAWPCGKTMQTQSSFEFLLNGYQCVTYNVMRGSDRSAMDACKAGGAGGARERRPHRAPGALPDRRRRAREAGYPAPLRTILAVPSQGTSLRSRTRSPRSRTLTKPRRWMDTGRRSFGLAGGGAAASPAAAAAAAPGLADCARFRPKLATAPLSCSSTCAERL